MKKLLLILFCSSIIIGCSNNKNNDSNEQNKYAHLPNTIRGKLNSIPDYVDTSKAEQTELKSSTDENDSLMNLFFSDSLFADSVVNFLSKKYGPDGLASVSQCGQDGSILFNRHLHIGRWVDETGYEWLFWEYFANDTLCPICNRILD